MSNPSENSAPNREDSSRPVQSDGQDHPKTEARPVYRKPFLRPRDEALEGDMWCD
jgi:hypothetical protein